jgi:hypothetical protein
MYVKIIPVSEIAFPGADKDTQLILRAVRSCILQETDGSLGDACSFGVNWANVIEVSSHNRLGVLLLRGLNRNAIGIPLPHRAAMEKYQLAAVRTNAVNLVTLRHVIPKLESGGVKSIVLKGPVAQKLIHGDFFSKPSFDVDLLVSPAEYEFASQLIVSNGFALARECSSPWWRVFLGEQHFFSSGPLQSTLDLHYRTQQPGSPGPRENGRFIAQSVGVFVGGMHIYTLSRENSCLLSCMSLCKALIHREPAGGHVCDIAAFFKCHQTEQLKRLFEEASGQGLRNTLALGLRAAYLLFGIKVELDEIAEKKMLRSTSDADLMMMILSPHAPAIRWPRRSKMLWDLCDDKSAYPRAISWKIGGDICRQLYQDRGRSSLSLQR